MRIVLYVEGDTEFRCLPGFLQRWLDSRIQHKVAIKAINFKGVGNYYYCVIKHEILKMF